VGRVNRGLKAMTVFLSPQAMARIRRLEPKVVPAEFIRNAIEEKLERVEHEAETETPRA
jgi:DNA recombination-dependent growth factor C